MDIGSELRVIEVTEEQLVETQVEIVEIPRAADLKTVDKAKLPQPAAQRDE